MSTEPILDVAQLAHVEMLSPKAEDTVKFFVDLLGMDVVQREGQSVFLRGYEDPYHHSLKITEAPEPGLGHVAWRVRTPEALDRRVAALEQHGAGNGWVEDEPGHGRAFQFATPDGHRMELFYDVDYAVAPPGEESGLLNRPQRRPSRGVPVRRIDHVNLMSSAPEVDTAMLRDALGFQLREQIVTDDEAVLLGSWMSVTNQAHDIAIMRDPFGSGRFHHVCFWYGVPQHLNDLVELLKDHEIQVEGGPGKHGVSQAMFLYVFEPGGNRVELFGDTGYLIFDPAWKPRTWKQSEIPGRGDVWVGQALPDSFWTYGTPVVEVPAEPAEPAAV
jgi:catechol 2,3-dioxygenase